MKKAVAVFLAVLMALSMVACGGTSENSKADDQTETKVDMSKYPSNLNEWSGQNFIDYFKEVGLFTDGNGFETWIQDHATYWPGTPVSECAGWWNDEGTVIVMITILSADNADTSEADLAEWLDSAKKDKTFPGDYATIPVDHLVGNVAFTFETWILDDDIYASFSAAYQELLTAMNVTAEM